MEIKERYTLAIKEDRERFFKKADVYVITNNRGLTETQIAELEVLRGQFRDVTSLEGFPDIDWPIKLPEWFPNPYFASSFKKGDMQNELDKKLSLGNEIENHILSLYHKMI